MQSKQSVGNEWDVAVGGLFGAFILCWPVVGWVESFNGMQT